MPKLCPKHQSCPPRWRGRLSLILIMCLSVACDESTPVGVNTEGAAGESRQGDVAGGSQGGVERGGDLSGAESGERGGGESPTRPAREVSLSPAALARLSQGELYETVRQVFGVTPTSPLEVDTRLHGFTRVANSELSLSPLYVEQLEQLSWEVADLVMASPERAAALFPCGALEDQSALEGARLERYEQCLSASLLRLGQRAWRRPLSEDELATLMNVYAQVTARQPQPLEGRRAALGALIAVLIQAPDFVFRVEVGEPDPEGVEGERRGGGLTDPANLVVQGPTWRYTGDELASRLSYLLWGGPPDDELFDVAASGALTERETLRSQAERMLADPRAAARLVGFFDELVGLPNLDAVSKDAVMFPDFSPALRASMRAEIAALFTDVVFTRDADVRELLTSERAEVDASLAALYGLTPPADLSEGERFEVDLPAAQARGGLLGRAAPLALFSHATVSSPTFRGRFVRAGLLCQDIPPPPEGVVTELESDDGEVKTLRERLERHATDPACVGCHQLMDPLGFPLERFDPVGRWRELDEGLPIDTTGDLDGVAVNDARTLGAAVANSPYYADCLTRKLYRYAVAHLETDGEIALVDALSQHLMGSANYRLSELIVELILSDGFRRLAPPEALEDESGMWVTPGAAGAERCDGVDQDQDGRVDEGVVRACESSCTGWGGQRCQEGAWGECEAGPAPEEVCDGEDNDCDGEVDEDVETSPELCDGEDNDCDGRVDEEVSASSHDVDFMTLSAQHPGCQSASSDQSSCNAAIHRFCNSLGCGGSGFGPVEIGQWSAQVICVPSAQTQIEYIAYADLAARHDVCDAQRESIGPNCNAAIHRHCRETGQRTGFGPVERGPAEAVISCVPQADVIHTTYTELSTHHGSCQRNGERIGHNCNAAINRLCRARGYLSGWGPLENSQDISVVACVR